MFKLELERRKRGMTQADVGKAANVDPSYICKAERYGVCYDAHLERIAKALGWSGEVRELFEEVK